MTTPARTPAMALYPTPAHAIGDRVMVTVLAEVTGVTLRRDGTPRYVLTLPDLTYRPVELPAHEFELSALDAEAVP